MRPRQHVKKKQEFASAGRKMSGANYRSVSTEAAAHQQSSRSKTAQLVSNGFGYLQRDAPPRMRTPPRTPPREPGRARYPDPNLAALRHDVLPRSEYSGVPADRRAVSSSNVPSHRRKQQASYDALGAAPHGANKERDLRFPQSAAHSAKFSAAFANGAAHYMNPMPATVAAQPHETAQWVRANPGLPHRFEATFSGVRRIGSQ